MTNEKKIKKVKELISFYEKITEKNKKEEEKLEKPEKYNNEIKKYTFIELQEKCKELISKKGIQTYKISSKIDYKESKSLNIMNEKYLLNELEFPIYIREKNTIKENNCIHMKNLTKFLKNDSIYELKVEKTNNELKMKILRIIGISNNLEFIKKQNSITEELNNIFNKSSKIKLMKKKQSYDLTGKNNKLIYRIILKKITTIENRKNINNSINYFNRIIIKYNENFKTYSLYKSNNEKYALQVKLEIIKEIIKLNQLK